MKRLCPFCDPAQYGDKEFYQSKNFRAICNITPILPGHSLVIPKRHIENFMDLKKKDLIEMIDFSRKVMKILKKTFKTCDFDWTIQEGKCSGKTIPHLHLHLIPRKKDDLPLGTNWYSLVKGGQAQVKGSHDRHCLTPLELRKIIQKIQKHLN